MTWQSAKAHARERAAAIIARLGPDPRGAVVPLSEYPTAEDFAAILGGEEEAGWPHTYHAMVNRAVVRELKRAGVEVLPVPMRAAEYLPWLHRYGVPNCPELRAQYVGLVAAGALHRTPPLLPPTS